VPPAVKSLRQHKAQARPPFFLHPFGFFARSFNASEKIVQQLYAAGLVSPLEEHFVLVEFNGWADHSPCVHIYKTEGLSVVSFCVLVLEAVFRRQELMALPVRQDSLA